MKTATKFWIGLAVLAVLSPIGIILPAYFKSGKAWGEWSREELQKIVGYIPQGAEKLGSLWNAPMSDYMFKGWDSKGLAHLSIAYIVSALLGIAIVVTIMLFLGKFLSKK